MINHEISSVELHKPSQDPLALTQTEHPLSFGDLQVHTATATVSLDSSHRMQAETIVQDSLDQFYDSEETPEPTLAHGVAGRPTLLARIDCTIDQNNQVRPYEVEERPAGTGVIHRLVERTDGIGLQDAIHKHYQEQVGGLPIVGMSPLRTYGTDDNILFEVVTLKDLPAERAVLLRVEPKELDNAEHERLVTRSVAPIRDEGKKSYSIRTGQATLLTDPETLDESTSCVIKPLQGSKARGVSVYLSPRDRGIYGKRGASSYSKVQRELVEAQLHDTAMIREDLKPPVRVIMPDGKLGNLILRLLVTVGPHDVHCLGGAYVARQEMIVHGASNAISGPVVV